MEKVVDNSGSISVSDKKSSSSTSSNIADVAGNNPTSMKKKTQGTSPPHDDSKMMMTDALHHREEDLSRPFTGGRTAGPTKCRGGGANEAVMGAVNMKRVRDDDDVLLKSRGGFLSDEKPSPNLQPFDIFVPADASYKSAGMGMGFPFTQAQWQELARQAMIFKYMISSVPVPHNLLRIALDSSAASSVKYPRNGSDPEPGRCKRTDGKKWRCSRDVAPQQKYCERHLHRGRPRSRKRVEAKLNNSCNNNNNNNNNTTTIDESHKKTRLQQNNTTPLKSISRNSSQFVGFAASEDDNVALYSLFGAGTDLTISSSCYKGPAHRDLGLMMIGTENNTVVEELPNIESGNVGFSMYGPSMVYNQDCYYMDLQHQPMDLLSPSKFSVSEIEPPIGLWSVDHSHKEPSLSLSPNHESLSSSLTLSMAMSLGEARDYQEMGRTQEFIHYDYPKTTEDSRCFIGPNSWEPFGLGGPLAEALQPNSGSNPTSPPYDYYPSQVATAVSSPSGVLHRTLFSHSDNSACNSPTIGVAQPPESAFRWLN